ncbi:unknown [Fusobacterium sp. CAG:439]|nr:unknown [Fusobacterium sp. CAG:439]
MKPINFEEIKSLQRVKQHFHDCYLVTSLNSLSNSENGRKILQNNILREGSNFKIKFKNVNGNQEDFFITEKEIDDLTLCDRFFNPIELKEPHNPIIKAIEVAMNKLLSKFPDKKSFINRLYKTNEQFEYNNPSRFMEMFTGITPLNINEKSFRMSLRKNSDDAKGLFQQIGNNNNSSFIVGTGHNFINGMTNWHCYTLEKVDNTNKTIQIFDHRFQEKITMPFDEAVKKLKYITGYFNENLK